MIPITEMEHRVKMGEADMLSREELAAVAMASPDVAMIFAAECLPPEMLDWCAEQQPTAAIEWAAHLLSPDRLEWCIVQRRQMQQDMIKARATS